MVYNSTQIMRMIHLATYVALGVGVLTSGSFALAETKPSSTAEVISTQVEKLQSTPDTVAKMKMPKIAEPTWLVEQNAAEQAASQKVMPAAGSRVVTYDVTTRGAITANVAEFRAQANATLNDGRGWSRLGVVFQEVEGGGTFTLVLSEASQMTSFSSGCGTEYSCRAGRYVIINQDRWLGATPSWNNAGGSLRDYRHMVINHETGHWLGHDHENCSGAGHPAQVMQQQSIDLQGCSFNPWPTASELWSSQLGISL